jgi:NTP pyrophosphatase (non-canonical NTP hydrolase)
MSTIGDNIDLNFIARQLSKLFEEMGELRRQVRQVQESQVGVMRAISHLDTRIADNKADLESMVKVEIGGAIANLETRQETSFNPQFEAVKDELGQVLTIVRELQSAQK